MSEANADKTPSPDTSAKPASSPDELIKDLDVTLSEDAQSKIIGGQHKEVVSL